MCVTFESSGDCLCSLENQRKKTHGVRCQRMKLASVEMINLLTVYNKAHLK